MNSNKKLFIYLPFLFAITLIAGIFWGSRLVPVTSKNSKLFHLNMNRYDKLSDMENYILQEYVDSVSREDLTREGINGILSTLDPHSQYIAAEEFHEVNDPLIGNFEGIGVQFRIEKDTLIVVQPIAGGPSEKVGIMAGDRIVTVNDSLIAGNGLDNKGAMKVLKGKKGSLVKVGIFRRGNDELLHFEITRDVIPTYSVDISYMPDKITGYIKVSKFSATTFQEFHKAIEELLDKGMQNLILDLRGNTGGYLQEAIDMADEFLEDGKLIVYTKGRNQPKEVFRATSKGKLEKNSLILLIDENSASASEIFAGAIQDNDRGLIVGRRSFGKGLVQRQLDFLDGSALRLTVARYYTPTGRCIQKPYDSEAGFDGYYTESYHRYYNGEMDNQDSTHFNDSLKFVTPGGKVVYGGGGIMPDVFIPIEKDERLVYYNQLFQKGLMYRFAFEFTDDHREMFKQYASFSEFNNGFDIEPPTLKKFVDFAIENGVEKDTEGLRFANEKIKVLIKAYIGRNLYDDKGFYPVLLPSDSVFIKALELIENPA
ncbi:MAG: S41 family peptidase [Chlorobi bacterium]|nr:S41 family peptidase [Chlorobiota bacterium]